MNNVDPSTFSHSQSDSGLVQTGAEPMTQSGWKAEWTLRIRGFSQSNRLPRGFREHSTNPQSRSEAINAGVAPLAETTEPSDTQMEQPNWADQHQDLILEAIQDMTSMAPVPLRKTRKKAVPKSKADSPELA